MFCTTKNQQFSKGLAPLHMAIINEDVNAVLYLINMNADLHQRCTGRFFCPDDQKDGQYESLTSEHPALPVKTNYQGFSYYGEYPLSFAAVTNQIDIVRILLAKGADPNKQDSNGNTVIHLMILNNNMVINLKFRFSNHFISTFE